MMIEKVLYIHGFASAFDPENDKVKQIRKCGYEVVGPDLDYSKPKNDLLVQLKRFIVDEQVDYIIGTSMGGYFALELSDFFSIPTVAINPAIQPYLTLKPGTRKNYKTNKDVVLTQSVINTYGNATDGAYGFIVLNMDDDVIDPNLTIDKYSRHYNIVKLESGGHRCDNFAEVMPQIHEFFNRIYGISLDEDL